jgi:hypothetical protein
LEDAEIKRTPRAPELRRSVRQHLAMLGDTPTKVADRLAGDGVRGRPCQATECAVARYTHAVIGSEVSISRVLVMNRTLRIYRTRTSLPVVVRLPTPITTFVQALDGGYFPNLVERGASPVNSLPSARRAEPRTA